MNMLQDPQYKSADGAALRIWRDAAPNRFLTEKLGRQVFDEVIYVEVIAPGSGNSTPTFEVERNFDENMNYPEPLLGPKYEELKQYIEAFKLSEKGVGVGAMAGTPLEQWPEMNRSLCATLKAQGIFTVDALSVLPDGKLNVVGPDGRTWREKAKAFLENAKDGAYATGLAAENENLKTTIAAGQAREKELADLVQKLQTQVAVGGTASAAVPEVTKKTTADAIAEVAVAQAQQVGGAPAAVAAEGEKLVLAPDAPVASSLPII